MNATSDKGVPARRRIRSIEVGFRVIRALLSAQRATPLRDIAAAAGMPPSKAHLYLASFVREGMAYQDPETGHYGLGPFAVRLGLSALRQLSSTRHQLGAACLAVRRSRRSSGGSAKISDSSAEWTAFASG